MDINCPSYLGSVISVDCLAFRWCDQPRGLQKRKIILNTERHLAHKKQISFQNTMVFYTSCFLPVLIDRVETESIKTAVGRKIEVINFQWDFPGLVVCSEWPDARFFKRLWHGHQTIEGEEARQGQKLKKLWWKAKIRWEEGTLGLGGPWQNWIVLFGRNMSLPQCTCKEVCCGYVCMLTSGMEKAWEPTWLNESIRAE